MSAEIEIGVLGSLMSTGEITRAQAIIQGHDFNVPLHRAIWDQLVAAPDLHDPISVAEGADLDLTAVVNIARQPYSSANLEHYCNALVEDTKRRDLGELARTVAARVKAGDETDAILTELASKSESIALRNCQEDASWTAVLTATLEQIDLAHTCRVEKRAFGVPTGIMQIDARIGGARPGQLVVVAARPGIGKTAFCLQWMLSCSRWEERVGTGMLSLEMSIEDLGVRALAHELGINGSGLSYGEESAVAQLKEKLPRSDFHERSLWIDDATFSLGAIVARITEWVRRHKIKIAFVDHIGLVEVHGSRDARTAIEEVTRTLKKLAKRLDIVIVAVSQLNRSAEKEARRPRMSDLRESGSIEQDADLILMLHQSEMPDERGISTVEMGLLKNRVGLPGWLQRGYRFDGKSQSFVEMEESHEVVESLVFGGPPSGSGRRQASSGGSRGTTRKSAGGNARDYW